MRTWVVAVVLLAGCSTTSGGGEAPAGPEAPIAGEDHAPPAAGGAAGEVVLVADDGDMAGGVDEAWTFSLDPNATWLEVTVTVGSMAGLPTQVDGAVQTTLSLNGTEISRDGDDTTSVTVAASSGTVVFSYEERGRDGGPLRDHAGDWTLALEADPAVAQYAVEVVART